MNKCQKCGNSLPAEAKFCNVCGEKIIHKVFCTNCGRELKEEQFCPNCGTLSPTSRISNSNPAQQFNGTYQTQQPNLTQPITNNSELADDEPLAVWIWILALLTGWIGFALAVVQIFTNSKKAPRKSKQAMILAAICLISSIFLTVLMN